MAFPFYPFGLITATLFLAGTLVLLRLFVLLLDRGAAELRGSIGPGLVRGVEAWIVDRDGPDAQRPAVTSLHPAKAVNRESMPAGAILEDLAGPADVAVEAIHKRGR